METKFLEACLQAQVEGVGRGGGHSGEKGKRGDVSRKSVAEKPGGWGTSEREWVDDTEGESSPSSVPAERIVPLRAEPARKDDLLLGSLFLGSSLPLPRPSRCAGEQCRRLTHSFVLLHVKGGVKAPVQSHKVGAACSTLTSAAAGPSLPHRNPTRIKKCIS